MQEKNIFLRQQESTLEKSIKRFFHIDNPSSAKYLFFSLDFGNQKLLFV